MAERILFSDKVIKFLTNLSRLRCSHKVCVFFLLPYSFEVVSDNCVKEGIMHSKETSIPSGLSLRYTFMNLREYWLLKWGVVLDVHNIFNRLQRWPLWS